MPRRSTSCHRRATPRAEDGFSLIELLVVIVIVGILAAIAIPALLGQRGTATNTQAKVVVRTAETAMETFATDNGGSYSGATAANLSSIEPTLSGSSGTVAYLASVSAPDASDYTVVARDPVTTEDFSVVRTGGAVTRLCSPTGRADCPASGSW